MSESNPNINQHDLVERVTALEIRLAYQDQTIAALDEVIQEQFSLIDHLKSEMEQLKAQLESAPDSAEIGSLLDERPPHY
mgnify:CR=1 FL=1